MNKKYIANAAKPIGELGKKRVAEMNAHHAPLASWAFSFLPLQKESVCLDLGCGGGGTIAFLLSNQKISSCVGIDYSKVAVQEARKKNDEAIKNGRCEVIKGDVSALPFEDGTFDLVSAVETLYFWPDPSKALKEAKRVLKEGGKILLVNEDDGNDKEKAERLKNIMPSMRFYDSDKLTFLLAEAGFTHIEVYSKAPWISAIGQK